MKGISVEHLVSNLITLLGSVPVPLIYLLAAVWLGLESAGIGVPIEPMLLFVGSLAAQGTVNPILAVVATGLGCLAFATLAYGIGRREGTAAIARVGRFVGLNQTRADHIELWLRRRGALGVFIARETPLVRTYGSFIMGAADVPLPTFMLGTFAGALLYCGIFITLGDLLGANYRAPLHYLDQFGVRGVAIAAAVVLVAVILHHFWGRLTWRRLAAHFRRHHAAATVVPATIRTY